MWNRRDVADRLDFDADRLQRTHRRLAAGAGALDPHFERRMPYALAALPACRRLGRRERRPLREPLKPRAGARPRSALPSTSVIVITVLLKDAWMWA